MNLNRPSTEHQQSINDFGCCIVYNPRAVLLCLHGIKEFAAFRGNIVSVNIATTENEREQSIHRASTEHQQSSVLYLLNPKAILRHIPIINVMPSVIRNRDRDMVISPV
jgi:hypothetical protein